MRSFPLDPYRDLSSPLTSNKIRMYDTSLTVLEKVIGSRSSKYLISPVREPDQAKNSLLLRYRG